MGGFLGQKKATTLAFILEAEEGPIGARVTENEGARALVDANSPDPLSRFSRKAVQGTAGTAELLTSNIDPLQRFLKGDGWFAPGLAQTQRGALPLRSYG